MSKIGKKKRIAGKKNKWEKSNIGSGLIENCMTSDCEATLVLSKYVC